MHLLWKAVEDLWWWCAVSCLASMTSGRAFGFTYTNHDTSFCLQKLPNYAFFSGFAQGCWVLLEAPRALHLLCPDFPNCLVPSCFCSKAKQKCLNCFSWKESLLFKHKTTIEKGGINNSASLLSYFPIIKNHCSKEKGRGSGFWLLENSIKMRSCHLLVLLNDPGAQCT